MAKAIKVVSGHIEEYENGVRKRTYGTNVKQAVISNDWVVAVNNNGQIEEYINGTRRRTY